MKSWKSRKFIVFAVTLILYLANDFAGDVVQEDTLQSLLALVVGWLVSQGIADAGWSKATSDAKTVADAIEGAIEGSVDDSEEDTDA